MKKALFWISGAILWIGQISFLNWWDEWNLTWWPSCVIIGIVVNIVSGILIKKFILPPEPPKPERSLNWIFWIIILVIWVIFSAIWAAIFRGISNWWKLGLAWWPNCWVSGIILGIVTLLIIIYWIFWQTTIDESHYDPDYQNPSA